MKYLILLLVTTLCSCQSIAPPSFNYGKERADNYLNNFKDDLEVNKVLVLQEALNVINVYMYNYERMQSVGFENMIPRIANKWSSEFYRPLVVDFLLKEHSNLLKEYGIKPWGHDYHFHLSSLRDGLLVVVLEKSHKMMYELPATIDRINRRERE